MLIRCKMDEPWRFGSFHLKDGELTNHHAVYVRPTVGVDVDRRSDDGNIYVRLNTERTLLRNILYCFHFLDTQDRDYINSSEAEEYIRQIKDNNPELFDIMYNVLLVVKRTHGDDKIAKELFIQRCEESLRELSPHDASPINRLRSPVNPLTEYFSTLKKSIDNTVKAVDHEQDMVMEERGAETTPYTPPSFDVDPITETGGNFVASDEDESYTNSEDECTFRPKINKTQCPGMNTDASLMLKEEMEEIHRFKCYPGTVSGMNEYIVFHFNNRREWPNTLRALKGHREP